MTVHKAARGEHYGGDPAAAPHPFAAFIRIVGRGETLSRPLNADEAEAAMAMILDGRVTPEQLGAFLLVLRYRKESPEELAGFVRATQASAHAWRDVNADLDWPCYADRHKQLPYFALAARLLARAGRRVVMHGLAGDGTATTRAALAALGVSVATVPADATAALDRDGLVYVPIEAVSPAMARLFALRPVLGVRSAANSFARALNPLGAAAQMIGVFHPTYLAPHRDVAIALDQPRAAIFKGGGGEAQRNPEKPCRVVTVRAGRAEEVSWPALTADRYPWRGEPLDVARIAALWDGSWSAAAPRAAVIGTAAIALSLFDPQPSQAEALDVAEALWAERAR